MSNFENLNDINSFTHFSELDISNIQMKPLLKCFTK